MPSPTRPPVTAAAALDALRADWRTANTADRTVIEVLAAAVQRIHTAGIA